MALFPALLMAGAAVWVVAVLCLLFGSRRGGEREGRDG